MRHCTLFALLALLCLQAAAASKSAQIASSAKPLLITFPNADVFLSPYNWRVAADGSVWAPTGGPYFKFSVTGTTRVLLNVDTTINHGVTPPNMPSVKVIVDDGEPKFVLFAPSATQVTLASGLSPASKHTLLVYAIGVNLNLPEVWTGTVAQTHIRSLQFDRGAKLSPYPIIRQKNCFILGDSILQGYYGLHASGNYYSYVDPSVTWAIQLGYVMGCEVGVVGVAGQGFLEPSNAGKLAGGYPPVTGSWNFYDSAHPRSFSPPPDYVIDAHGVNDHRSRFSAAAVQAAVQEFQKAVRSQLSRSKIFFYLPFGGQLGDGSGAGANYYPIKAAVRAAGDANTFLIDPSATLRSANTGVKPTWFSPNDGLHPAQINHGILAGIAAQQMQKALDAGSAREGSH